MEPLLPCVENRRWTVGRVTYATLNVQGLVQQPMRCRSDPNEYAARNAANIQWMKGNLRAGKTRNSVAVMFDFAGETRIWDLNDEPGTAARRKRW